MVSAQVGGDASVVPGFRASHLVSVEASCDATLVVAFDARATCRPLWLLEGGFGRRPSAGGRRTARIFASDGAKAPVRFDLYEKDVAPGDVTKLGCVASRGDAKSRARDAHMYAAFVVARGAAAAMNDFSDDGDASSDDGDASSDGDSSYYESAREEEAPGDEFFDCVDDDARAAAPARAAARVHLLSSADALVVAGGGATFAASLGAAAAAGAPVPFELGDKALCLAVSGAAAARVVAVLPRFVVLNALPCRLAVRAGDALVLVEAGARAAAHVGRRTAARLQALDGGAVLSSRGDVRLDAHGSTPVALADASRGGVAVADLAAATVARVEARPRAGAGDDFGTLLCVGLEDAAVAAPLVSVANETDVLVAVWQAGAAPRYWLVGPRSAAPFGWDDPSARDRRVAVVALANRSRADAAAFLRTHGRALARAAPALRVDGGGDRRSLPLADEARGALDVLSEHWGVDAVVDARGGGAVLRVATRSTTSYDAALHEACLPSPGQDKESEIPSFKGSYLGRVPLVSADFWTSDHLLERSRSVDAVSGTRARGTLTLKRR